MPDDGTQELVRRAADGDQVAVARIMERYSNVVRRAIRRRLGGELRTRVDTDDVFQSAMLAAIQDLSKFEYRGEAAFVGWLTSIADWRLRRLVSHHRVAKRDPRRECGLDAAADRVAVVTDPPLGAHRSDVRERIRAAIARLPEPDREVVRLRSFAGLTFREIADAMALADCDAARYIHQRGLARLADLVEIGADGEDSAGTS